MKIAALLSVHNEERVIQACLDHLIREGLHFYVINDRSSDRTMEIVSTYADRGLLGVTRMPHNDHRFNLAKLMELKTTICRDIDADWFISADADEFRTSNNPGETLAEAIERIDREGYNAINFQEYTFIPTMESPHHRAESFLETMRWYYPFLPHTLHRLNAWKNTGQTIDLVTDGGHRVHFSGRIVCHQSLPLRHYLYISKDHFTHKYKNREHASAELEKQWHGWREKADEALFCTPPEKLMRTFDPECPWKMDASSPRLRHMLEDVNLWRDEILESSMG